VDATGTSRVRSRTLRTLGFVLVWLVVAVPTWLVLFTHSSSDTVVASHDAVVSPRLDGQVRLDMGPYLPDVLLPSRGRIGVDVVVGKTTANSGAELAQRYAAIAAHPDAEQQRVREEITDLATYTAIQAGVLALLPLAAWWLVGPRRRAELRGLDKRVLIAVPVALSVGAVLLVQPWLDEDEHVQGTVWLPIQDAVPDVTVPQELTGWKIQGGLFTSGTRRLLDSAFDTYAKSKVFYRDVAGRVDEVAGQLLQPAEGETVAVLVSDRHDNIGMDEVVRAIADRAGATAVIDAGDDTSTGETWEAFSLDSLDRAFTGYDAKVAIAGNHDNGTFVSRYLEKRGWTHLDGRPVEPFGNVRMTGVDDPRSSGLGNWRDQKGLSFAEVTKQIADDVCAADAKDERIATLVVHDANLGAGALERGCTDLVLAGHLHVQKGPTRVVGSNGKAGYTYTNGTTGGAAYAIAIGSKLRREAELTFVTYRKGKPVGIQPVKVTTVGEIVVAPYVELDLG
jgi:hypothetical protein